MYFKCLNCGKEYPLNSLKYKCDCGGIFNIKNSEKIKISVSLGEVTTPILKRKIGGKELFLKLDYMMPTGSFKDRGALVLINKLLELNIQEVVEDSSGNAGASVAAYCVAAGIKCNIYLPASTSERKIKQIKAYGANIIKVKGSRKDTSREVFKVAGNKYYASHIYNPLFIEGTKTVAYEIKEQVGVPDYIFSPVGNGTMLLGIYKGFSEMNKLPHIIGVQSANCSPIYNEFKGINNLSIDNTIAEGIAIEAPVRMNQIVNAIKDSEGDMMKVTEEEIIASRNHLNNLGIYVEPTSATTLAGAKKFIKSKNIDDNYKIVIPLTGMGLKK